MATVDELLAAHTDEIAAVARWLRSVVLGAMPDAREKVWLGWHGLGYHHPTAGYVVGVFPRTDDVHLLIEHGAALVASGGDPRGLLTGTGSQTRVVAIREIGVPPEQHLVKLVDAAVERRDKPG